MKSVIGFPVHYQSTSSMQLAASVWAHYHLLAPVSELAFIYLAVPISNIFILP